jgi:signal transduction histidine kinase
VAPRLGVELPSLLPGDLTRDATDADDARRPRTVRDWLVDLSCFVLAIAVGGLLFAHETNSADPRPMWLLLTDLALGVPGCLALWWRRRWPVGIAIALTLVGAISASGAMAATIIVFTVAVHRRASIAVAITAANVVGVPIYGVIQGWEGPAWGDLVIGVLITLIALGWGMLVRARRQLVVSLRDRAVRAEAEQQLRVDQARRLERARIAREMHDVLAHRLSLLSVHAGALEFRTDANHEQVAQAAGVIRNAAHQALQELREVIGVLREDDAAPPVPGDPGRAGSPRAAPEPPQPGLAEIPSLLADSTTAGARIRYRPEVGDPAAVPSSIARTAYRVVQEGVTNARKHAPGVPIDVLIGDAPGAELVVEVTNAVGTGSTSSVPGAGMGLIGLTERVQLAGGRLEHGPDAAGRFVLRARLPCR